MERVHFSQGMWLKVFCLCFLTTSLYVSAEGWVIEVVDLGGQYGVSIATDSTSYPHIAYSGSGSKAHYLKYARRDSSGRMIETVDSSTNVAYVSLSLDGTDTPHIGYYDVADGDLRYARRDTTGWFIESVDTGGVVGKYASIGINSAGYPGISYYDQTSGDLKYATSDGEHWIIERVDTTGNVGSFSSLAFDQTDNPHISCYDATNYCLKYARKNLLGWSVTVVDSPSHEYQRVGRSTSLALDSLGHPHVSYYYWEVHDLFYDGLRYARWDGSEWRVETPAWGELEYPTGIASSIDLDRRDSPRIAYLVGWGGGLDPSPGVWYTTRSGEGWRKEFIDSLSWESNVSLSLDATFSPHVAYCVYDTASHFLVLKHATRPTVVREDENTDPSRRVILEQPYPNPFSPQTTIWYGLTKAGRVTLKVYNLLGQEIRVLVDRFQGAGTYRVVWDSRDNAGTRVSSGTYFLRLAIRPAGEAGQHSATSKLCVVR